MNNTENKSKNEIKDSSENLNLYERNLQPKIKDIDVYKASDLQIFEESVLCSKFGEKAGRWLYRVCRGIDDEPGYFIVGLFCYICSFLLLCGYFALLMPYWLFYVSNVEDRFFNTLRL
jgi:hypothetical protein